MVTFCLKLNTWLAVVALLVLPCGNAIADDRVGELKAAFIYNFAKFVEWPAEVFGAADAPLHLCVFNAGKREADTPLGLLDGRVAQGRLIRVRQAATEQELKQCQLLYLPAGDNSAAQSSLLDGLGASAILTISEDLTFVEQGGMVSLFVDGDHVRFSINLKAAQRARLKISARMLQLAREVR